MILLQNARIFSETPCMSDETPFFMRTQFFKNLEPHILPTLKTFWQLKMPPIWRCSFFVLKRLRRLKILEAPQKMWFLGNFLCQNWFFCQPILDVKLLKLSQCVPCHLIASHHIPSHPIASYKKSNQTKNW